MKNATQYLKKSGQFKPGAHQEKVSQPTSHPESSSNHNVDLKSLMGGSGESFNFRNLWNMPFTPPTADAMH